MHFTLPVFFSFINLSLALAVTPSNPTNSTANTTFTPPSRYYLKTSVIGAGNADKNDLYVSSYHTGPGLSDATLLPFSPTSNTVGFLNDTHQQFDLHSSVPFGMIMEPSENLDVAWNFVRINELVFDAGYGSTDGFSFNASGLQWDGRGAGVFVGWLACDWWHGVPQLFWEFFFVPTGIPSSCAQVELHPVAV
ncbi:hypothetical protein HO173_005940 [Letharia columbiana]|uniref:DUF7907 domain-containing protein n=1 Tax=Letharia columbiana TaxID=112416 RepID=A0A8H6L515_9LECA|nr:uncharacterized protein HO173_005940 [Letharia columbiana]KAF6235745.1 hypothetical protein HO173_005940 [Letharia columbiana]